MIALHKFALLAYLGLYMFDTSLVHIIPIDPKKMQISYMSLRLIVYGDDVVRLGWQFMRSIKLDVPKFTKPTKQPLVSRLWDFLVQYDGFPVKQAIEVFGLTTRQVKAVGDALEDSGILMRGDSNARVLNKATLQSPDWSYKLIMPNEAKLAQVLDKTIAKA